MEFGADLDRVLGQLRAISPLADHAELTWFQRVDALADDALAALRWTLDNDRAEVGLHLAVLMAPYWWVLGRCGEGRTWLDAFLERAERAEPELLEGARRWRLALEGEDDPA